MYKILFHQIENIPPNEKDLEVFEDKVNKYLQLGYHAHGELEMIFRGTNHFGRPDCTFLKQVMIKK